MPLELPPGTASYSDRSPPPKNRQLLQMLGFFVGFAIALFASVQGLADVLSGLVPYGVEQQLGALIIPVYEQQAKASSEEQGQSSLIQDKLNQLVDRLETHLPDEPHHRDYRVIYIPTAEAQPVVNAMAIPGDRIIIYEGLLAQMESENELMMVLGHELGHFAHRDHLRRLGRGLLLQLVLAGVLGDVGSLQSIALSSATTLDNSRFSQDQEYQADRFGLDLLQQTYGQVAGATDFFARMSQELGSNIDFLTTHPGADKRVRRIETEIQDKGYQVGERSPLLLPLSKP
ncbi:MAG: M48 family metallopeptidase [Oscillatoriophycideae cyanobacterium NC_groundwater_1537_Pr4_S-0.65um_50_18]|nr:M48 family metallopeptidase [Oscillatoriophycideae cyanobacterium NC_groundwater_1537_Pr4_S-0.65um_50_18]